MKFGLLTSLRESVGITDISPVGLPLEWDPALLHRMHDDELAVFSHPSDPLSQSQDAR